MAPRLSSKQWALSLIILALVLILSLYQFFQITDNQFKLSFLDVGQGDAILIQTPEYKNILIDAGPDGKVVDELSKKLNFFNQKIDLFIMTHPDLDHYAGILDIFQKYPVKSVMITGIVVENSIYKTFLSELKTRQIPIIYPANLHDLQISRDLFLDFLYPLAGQSLIGQEPKNRNDTSISLIIRDGNGTPLALLTGDAEEAEELDMLLSGQDLKAPVFKLGHHGSKTASTEPFLQAIEPRTVIVSAGIDNKFGHPHTETLERVKGLNILSTTTGTISLGYH
ncbi:MBL fold metallo-hydrolase [Patescibacteria group bacterium]|nr:MBL fold metallo-hydrolase [Patescibacteria group bacterium]MBU1015742.1 MBL fold metallo-hydrolase [Patescibacteria group bacterium]MBU1685504.1 MBL fold metallo-hydrolase [Patescibacteria group bacterium]MBU1938710.1 MBL fold metallo-hydrolase [Patescibacteria group bacterium]